MRRNFVPYCSDLENRLALSGAAGAFAITSPAPTPFSSTSPTDPGDGGTTGIIVYPPTGGGSSSPGGK